VAPPQWFETAFGRTVAKHWFGPHPAWQDIALGLSCSAASTAARWLLQPEFGLSYNFVTYYLGITLAAILGGYRAGAIAWTASVVTAWWLFVPIQDSFVFRRAGDAVALGLFALTAGIEASIAAILRRTIIRLRATDENLRLVAGELNHRVKNSLAMVQSIARHTVRNSADLAEFDKAFQARLKAMAKAHDLLIREGWREADVRDVLQAELGVWGPRVALHDEPLTVLARTALCLSMIIHELATNAAKYGALSGSGQVEVDWRRDPVSSDRGLLEWRETGGPRVEPPSREGFGSLLITRIAQADLGGEAALEYRPEGVYARIRFPLA
jgi:two-component sensor histidine kinase